VKKKKRGGEQWLSFAERGEGGVRLARERQPRVVKKRGKKKSLPFLHNSHGKGREEGHSQLANPSWERRGTRGKRDYKIGEEPNPS